MKLARENHHPFDDRITFDEPTHIYTIDGDSSYTSVTTFLHHQFPPFHPGPVAANLLAPFYINGRPNKNAYRAKAIDNIRTADTTLTDQEAIAALDDTTTEHYKREHQAIIDTWSATSTAGTKIHADIEHFYNDEPRPNDSIEYEYFECFRVDFEREFPQYRPYRTEWTVFYKELKIAGSIDMVYENIEDGTLMIYDWKRVKDIKYEAYKDECGIGVCSDLPNTNFWHYSLQLNTYKAILESQYGKTVTALRLVRLYPDAPTYEVHECHDLQEKVKVLFENRKNELLSIKQT
ncbi:hypothetical protein EBS02_07255 [bacterium]|jgi:hypothetical protein|nr:hypothetical protein [bacterium]